LKSDGEKEVYTTENERAIIEAETIASQDIRMAGERQAHMKIEGPFCRKGWWTSSKVSNEKGVVKQVGWCLA
jgi:hypothetical protein